MFVHHQHYHQSSLLAKVVILVQYLNLLHLIFSFDDQTEFGGI